MGAKRKLSWAEPEDSVPSQPTHSLVATEVEEFKSDLNEGLEPLEETNIVITLHLDFPIPTHHYPTSCIMPAASTSEATCRNGGCASQGTWQKPQKYSSASQSPEKQDLSNPGWAPINRSPLSKSQESTPSSPPKSEHRLSTLSFPKQTIRRVQAKQFHLTEGTNQVKMSLHSSPRNFRNIRNEFPSAGKEHDLTAAADASMTPIIQQNLDRARSLQQKLQNTDLEDSEDSHPQQDSKVPTVLIIYSRN